MLPAGPDCRQREPEWRRRWKRRRRRSRKRSRKRRRRNKLPAGMLYDIIVYDDEEEETEIRMSHDPHETDPENDVT